MGALAACRAENTRVKGGSGPDPATIQLPVATTGTPTNVTWLGAMLNGVVNGYDQAVSVSWEYGTTTAYGKTTPTQNLGASGANQNVQAQIIGLTSTTTYHCRIRATNAAGQAYGQDVTFTTQAVGGAVPSVVGTPPVVSATFESDIAYDPISGFVTATLNGTVDAGSHAHATSYQFFLRRMDGIDVWHAINNPGTTSSTSPIAVSAYLGYILVTDADYEWYLSATNVKGTVTSVPILSFHTPAAPPPPGSPPTANTLSTANVTSTTALVTAEVNNVNTLAGTGSTNAWLRYKTGSAPLSATDYTTQVGPINLSPLNGNVVQQLPYTLTQLNSSVTYYVWAYAANPYGEADDWGSPLNFTTTAPSQLGTISVTTDPNWVAYGQATVFCTYTTPAAGTFSIRFGYRVSGSGAGYTFTSYESVAISVADATWDCVLGGLTPSKQYDITAELYDGSQTVQASQGGVITTFGPPTNSTGGATITPGSYANNFPGKGPGSRGTPSGPLGQAPTLNDIPTYADPRRPSSGLVSRTNRRKHIANIQSNPTYAAANLAAYAAYAANDGYDIVVYGLGHGVGGRTNYDVEIWDPQLVTALGGTTPPLVIPNTAHLQGGKALTWAVKAWSRHSDVVGAFGTFGKFSLTGGTTNTVSAAGEASWTTATSQGKVIVGVSVVGMTALGVGTELRIGNTTGTAGISIASRLGAFTNFFFKRTRAYQNAGNVTLGSQTNGGTNDGNWVYASTGGLFGFEYGRLDASNVGNQGFCVKWGIRHQSSNYRYSFRNNTSQYTKEHIVYVDNPSAFVSGVENGLAAPSWFMDNTMDAGVTVGATGDQKNPVQVVARRLDNVSGSPYACPTGCSCATKCSDNQSRGPDGMGDLHFIGNSWTQDFLSDTYTDADYKFVGHGGLIYFDATALKSGVHIGADGLCCKQIRPHIGADGYTYASKGIVVEGATTTYDFTQHSSQEALMRFDSCQYIEVRNFTVPAGFTKPVLMLSAKMYFPYVQGQDVQANGYCKMTMADPLNTWAGWPGGAFAVGHVLFGYTSPSNAQNVTSTTPPIIGLKYTVADVNALYAGVCRLYLGAPTTQPGGYVCPNV